MPDGLRSFFSSPYLAPITEPVKNVARFTIAPLRGFGEAFMNSLDGEYTGWPARFFSELTADDDHTGAFAVIGGFLTGVGGLIGGAIVASSAMTTGLGAVGAGLGGAIAGAALGAVAGPFVGAAAVGFGALVIGCVVGIVPGIVVGAAKAIKHLFSHKPDAPETAAPANDDVVATQAPAVRTVLRNPKTAAEMMQSFSTLQTEERKAFESIMMEQLRPAFEAAAAVVMPKDSTPAFSNKGEAFGKIGKLVV